MLTLKRDTDISFKTYSLEPMKILIFSYYLPYNDIDQYALKAHLKILSQNNEIILVSGVRRDEENLLKDTQKYCRKVYAVNLDLPDLSWKLKDLSMSTLLRGMINCFCFLSSGKFPWDNLLLLPLFFFFSKKMSDRLKEAFYKEKPCLVHFHKIIAAVHRRDIPPDMPSVFYEDDVTSKLFYTSMICERFFLAKAYYFIRYLGAKKWEKLILPTFQRAVLLSKKDKDWLLKINPSLSNVETVSQVIDTELFKPIPMQGDFPSLIFFGNLSLSYNKEALERFASIILPHIRKQIPRLKFYVVGPNPSLKIRSLSKNPLNKVTGFVKDLCSYIAKSTICIVPLNKSAGVKSRILISMSMAKTVVATNIATEGIEGLKDGENIVVANTPVEFVEKIIYLIKNPEINNSIGNRARQLIAKQYNVKAWEENWTAIYGGVTKNNLKLRTLYRFFEVIPKNSHLS